MNLFVATLNVGNRPLEPDQLNRWLREAKHCDVCIVCLQEAHVVTERHLERGKSVAALLAAGALAWPTWGVSCCLAIPYVCRQRRKREKRHEKEKQEARALSNPSLSPQQKRARVTLGSSRRIRDCLHHLGFSVRKKPSLAWGQLRCFVQRLVFFCRHGSPALPVDRVDGAEARRWRRGCFSRRVGSAVGSEVGSAVGSAAGSEKTTVYAGDTANAQAPRLREARRQCSLKTPQGRARRRPRRQPGPGHRRHGQQGRFGLNLRRREGGLRHDVHGDQRAFVCSRRPLVSNSRPGREDRGTPPRERTNETQRSYAPMAWRWTHKVLRSLDGVGEIHNTHRDKTKKNAGPPTRASSTSAWTPSRRS